MQESDAVSNEQKPHDLAVVGAGPAGLVAALAASHLGLSTVLVGPRANVDDGRSVALFHGSIQLLRNLNVWDRLAHTTAALDAIRLVDAGHALVRAPEVTFWARDIGRPAFGYSVPTAALTQALEAAIADRSTATVVERIETRAVTNYTMCADRVRLEMAEGGSVAASLVAAADGRSSSARTAAGIATKSWSYPQSAIVTSFTHSRPHRNISTEFHRSAGPLTVVPGPRVEDLDTSSLVWVDTPDRCRALGALPDADFIAELSQHLSGVLGRISHLTARRAFPLSGQTADVMGRNRVALIGEAGHVMPPIGAQGLNLSLRDAATLADVLAEAKLGLGDIGAPAVLAAYHQARHRDVASRIWSVDLLNRSLLSPYLPVHFTRGAGLYAMSVLAPLRRTLMREGMMPSHATPRLMRDGSAVAPVERGAAALDG